LNPSKSNMAVLGQIVKLIPPNLIDKLASQHHVSEHARTFSPTSHVVAMLHAQLSHSLSLNDTCDALRNHHGTLSQMRGATPPSRNGLSHANATRPADMAAALFWAVLSSMRDAFPAFVTSGRNYPRIPRRFKRTIHAVDSTTMQLVANCMDWAKHRRRKAAAKMHLRLEMASFLPAFALVREAKANDAKCAWPVCAGIRAGEIVVFDKAYVDYKHLNVLTTRGVFWVTRAKSNMQAEVVGQHAAPSSTIIRDERIRLSNEGYAHDMRRVEAWVEVNTQLVRMTFITNNFAWAASSICDLYRCRWGIEVFFKELKQTLQLADFMGYSENAVRWQVWTALLVYLLLRFVAWQSHWKYSFNRLFTMIRAVLWNFFDLFSVLACCGTAGGCSKELAALRACAQQVLSGV